MMSDTVLLVVGSLLISPVAAALAWLIARGAAWLKSKTHNQVLQTAVDLVSNVATVAVQGLEANVRPLLSAPGAKLDADGRKKIADAALTAVKTALANEGSAAAQKALDMGDEYLRNLIETVKAKLDPKPAAQPSPQ